MTDEDIGLTVSTYDWEVAEWKLVEFAWNNHHAVRSCGRVAKFSDKEDAIRFVKATAMKAALAHAAQKAFKPVEAQ
tara:strand:- start:927 stop:1154 length:228 start_codon:yes stop_codon:yes gene_type:complete